jgi:hypothetical protein
MLELTSTSRSTSMPKALTIAAMVVAALLFLVFGLDAAVGIPFGKASLLMDLGVVIVSAGLGYLGWATLRELK